MDNHNRQCFFLTENRPSYGANAENTPPWKNTRNYMNRMTVSEHDQFEISGFYAIPVETWDRERNEVKEESKNVSAEVISQLSMLCTCSNNTSLAEQLAYIIKNDWSVENLSAKNRSDSRSFKSSLKEVRNDMFNKKLQNRMKKAKNLLAKNPHFIL